MINSDRAQTHTFFHAAYTCRVGLVIKIKLVQMRTGKVNHDL